MKAIKILSILFSFFSVVVSCQSIINLDGYYQTNIPNAYYKDVNNKLNQFEGTWIYNDNTYYIKFVLVKKNHATVWNHYEDYLIGEFQYKKNGTEILNTLNNLNSNLSDPRDYGIDGNYFKYNHSPFDEYTTDNFRLSLDINENGCSSDIDVRTLIINGQQAIQIYKWKSLETATGCHPTIPEGFYYLIKQ